MKKLLLVLIGAVTLCTLTACGSSTSGSTAGSGDAPLAEERPENSELPEKMILPIE